MSLAHTWQNKKILFQVLKSKLSKPDLEHFLRREFLGIEISEYLVCLFVVIYATTFSFFTVLKYNAFETYAWDLGIFNQSFWTTLNGGKFFYHTLELFINPTGSFFAVHFSPVLLGVVPFYALFQRPETLLVLQSIVLASAALPLYLLVREKFQSRIIDLIFVAVYLAYAPLHSVNWFDFHVQAFFLPFLFSAFYFFEKKNWKMYFLFITLTLMVEEQIAIILIFYGLYILWSFRSGFYSAVKKKSFKSVDVLIPVLTIIMPLLYLLIVRSMKSFLFPINPEYLAEYRATWNWSILGLEGDPTSMPLYVLLNPQQAINAFLYDFPIKFLFVVFLFAPLIFLSLRSSIVLITLAWIGPALLSNNPAYYTLGSQYSAYVIPFVFLAGLASLKTISRDNLKTALALSTIIILLVPFFFLGLSPISPLPKFFNPQYVPPQITAHDEILLKTVALVPPDASILTQNNIFPHISGRSNAYAIFPHAATSSVLQRILAFTDNLTSNVQYILVDLNSDQASFGYALGKAASGNYGLYFSADRILLYKHNYTGKPFLFYPIEDNFNFKRLKMGDGDLVKDPTSESGAVFLHSARPLLTNVFWSGPYTQLPPGAYNATFRMKVDSIESGPLVILDVTVDGGQNVLAARVLSAMDFKEPSKWQNFTLQFELKRPYLDVEFRGINPSNITAFYLDDIQLVQEG